MLARTIAQGRRAQADNDKVVHHMSTAIDTRVGLTGAFVAAVLCALSAQMVSAQTQAPPRTAPATRPGGQPPTAPAQPAPRQAGLATTGMAIPTDYVIGPDDVLGIVFWRDTDMTGDVTVRPDGMITLPLIRDIKAAGLTPDQLRDQVTKAAAKFIEDPNVTVVVRQINSRNVFITGQVARPGPYGVSGQMTVLQLIAVAGGLTEFANSKNIQILRTENGQARSYKFNYNEVAEGKKLEQNIVLKPGDQVIVR
jgi:polysaccharide export outer membrane protein